MSVLACKNIANIIKTTNLTTTQESVLRFFHGILVSIKKVDIFASEKVLLGSEGLSSTKAVYVA